METIFEAIDALSMDEEFLDALRSSRSYGELSLLFRSRGVDMDEETVAEFIADCVAAQDFRELYMDELDCVSGGALFPGLGLLTTAVMLNCLRSKAAYYFNR